MAISFNEIPGNLRVPFTYVEIDDSRAAASGGGFRSLLIGQRLAAGAVDAEVPTIIGPDSDGERAFGRGSMLAIMVAAFRRANPSGELWCVALNDIGAAVKATTTITATAAATAAGTIALYIAGRRIQVLLSGATAVNDVSAAIAAAVNARTDLPVTAAAAAAAVTLTNRNGGAGLDVDVQVNYRADEAMPDGLALAIAAGVAGAGEPDIDDALDVLGDEQFQVIGTAYSSAASIAKLETELAARWGPTQQIDGVGIGAFRGTVGQATAYGNTRNSRHTSVMDHASSPNPVWEFAAGLAGAVALSAAADPARPFQTLPVPGILPGKVTERRTFTERNGLLTDGMSTYRVDSGGGVRIERMITTYQTNSGGVADAAYLNLTTPLSLGHLRADFRRRIQTKFPRFKLADDGTRTAPGQPIITPSVARAEAVAWAAEQIDAGLMEDLDGFKAALVVERNDDDADRLDFLIAADLANQFRIAGVKLAFIL